ncbi:hypothetical protein ACFX13_037444 [Malus domestica]
MKNTERDIDALNHSKEGNDGDKEVKGSNPDNLQDLLSSSPWGGGERIQETSFVCGYVRTMWTAYQPDLRISRNNQLPQQQDTIAATVMDENIVIDPSTLFSDDNVHSCVIL